MKAHKFSAQFCVQTPMHCSGKRHALHGHYITSFRVVTCTDPHAGCCTTMLKQCAMARAPKTMPKTKRQVRHSRSTRYDSHIRRLTRSLTVCRYDTGSHSQNFKMSKKSVCNCVRYNGSLSNVLRKPASRVDSDFWPLRTGTRGGLPLAWPLFVSADRTLFPHVRRMSIAHGAKSPRALHRQLSSQVTLLLTLGRADVMQIIGSKSGMEHACGSYNVEASVAQVQSCEECGATAMATEVYTKAPHVGLP